MSVHITYAMHLHDIHQSFLSELNQTRCSQRKNVLTLQTGFCGMEEFKNVTS